ncbi:MAG: flagellar assembly protein FliW [Oscillospiraceae bacterium]|jgi:flagellar assembly factor FliW|nr:flagellar assembly protein FliW [Oscillospiraceae bacterium]
MLKINTRDFGETEVDENEIISTPGGIPGFDEAKRFTLLCPKGKGVFPMFFQCVDEVYPCFIVCDAKAVAPDFTVELTEQENRQLKLGQGNENDSELTALFIVNASGGIAAATANTRSPIVINNANNIAIQVILPGNNDFRFPLFSNGTNTAKKT